MLAASEADDIAVIAAARGVSKSTLVRAWIRRAIARSKPGAVVYVDPRQEALFPLAARYASGLHAAAIARAGHSATTDRCCRRRKSRATRRS